MGRNKERTSGLTKTSVPRSWICMHLLYTRQEKSYFHFLQNKNNHDGKCGFFLHDRSFFILHVYYIPKLVKPAVLQHPTMHAIIHRLELIIVVSDILHSEKKILGLYDGPDVAFSCV